MKSKNLKIESLSLEQKIGQLFLIGFRGSDVSENSEIYNDFKNNYIGGVILFDKDMIYNKPVNNIENPEQVRNLVSTLKSYSDLPLFVSIDQEGGNVNRLKSDYGFPESKSHGELGKADDIKITETAARSIAETLKGLGINLNFAPVVDLAVNEEGPIAKRGRSFGKSSALVSKHAIAYSRVHRENEILTCAKHFPGHGSSTADSHLGFVDVTETWSEEELVPYKELISRDLCPMIMSAHVMNKKLDPDFPSTLSFKVLNNILRDNMAYKGVIISDDMQMRAISEHYGLKEALRLGLDAGIDIFCLGNNLLLEEIRGAKLVNTVKELVDEGTITEERINASLERIFTLKEKLI